MELSVPRHAQEQKLVLSHFKTALFRTKRNKTVKQKPDAIVASSGRVTQDPRILLFIHSSQILFRVDLLNFRLCGKITCPIFIFFYHFPTALQHLQ